MVDIEKIELINDNRNQNDVEITDAGDDNSGRIYNKVKITSGSEYYMKHPKRGLAMIFNHKHFDMPSLNTRSGTDVDCQNLANSLGNLDFQVEVKNDLELSDIKKEVYKISQQDHTNHDCLLISILSHGEVGHFYSKDTFYTLEEITKNFTADSCPSLAGKPKIFFIQACQGDKRTRLARSIGGHTQNDGFKNHSIPVHADFLVAHSTTPGFYAWDGSSDVGSWFIQNLCAELDTNGKNYDLITLLTYVNQRVALELEDYAVDRSDVKKNIPCFTTLLTKVLKFADKEFV